jgi:hypothetical protein
MHLFRGRVHGTVSLPQVANGCFLSSIPMCSSTAFGRLQPVAWKIGCTSALDPLESLANGSFLKSKYNLNQAKS